MRPALVVGLLLAIPAHAGYPGDEVAEDLIRAMRVDELVAQLVERDVRSECRVRKCAVDLKACLKTINRDEIMMWLVFVVEDELTPAEMKAATAYFRSDVGMRHREVIEATRNVGKASLQDQPPEIRTVMLKFLDTPAGYRLVTRAVLTNTERVDRIIERQASDVLNACQPAE